MTFRILGAPQRYVQGPNAIHGLGAEIDIMGGAIGGGSVAIIADPVAQEQLGDAIAKQVPHAHVIPFGGECMRDEIDRLTDLLGDAKMVVGMGGGKAIDTAKAVSIKNNLPIGIVPTIASNDSATSHIAVIYTPEHAVQGVEYMRVNPQFVLVDTTVIARAPRRFLAAGIGDAMSKPYELAGALVGGGLNFFGGTPTELTQAIVERAGDILLRDSVIAMKATEPTPEFERVVEASILLSGLAFESGGLSVAHSMVRGLSKRPELAHLLHGEMVVLGTLAQIAAGQGDVDELKRMADFYQSIDLPTDFKQFGLTDDTAFADIVDATFTAPYVKNYYKTLTPQDLITAMHTVNEHCG